MCVCVSVCGFMGVNWEGLCQEDRTGSYLCKEQPHLAIQIKTKLRNLFSTIRLTKIQKFDNIRYDEAERNQPFSYITAGNAQW